MHAPWGAAMSDGTPHRRWEDIRAEIGVAVAQAMTPFRLTLDRLDDQVQQLRTTVYGDPAIRQKGIVDRLEQIEAGMHAVNDKIDTLINESRARSNQIVGARKAFFVLAVVIGVVGGPPAIIGLLKALGIAL